MRDSQEDKALSIENKRRKAEGEALLATLDELEDKEMQKDLESTHPPALTAATEKAQDDDDEDVLLTEAANVLVDVLLIQQPNVALRSAKEASP